ncbi:MAG: F0F1 ATP synthase subunit B [Bacteroidetes bacterium]|nr:MAG: F0F1 ATP synthase subunit B [Bacteroidota bacterium]
MELITPNIGLIFWTTLVFLVVLFALTKFAWKPIVSAIQERDASIEKALKSAEEAKAEMAKLNSSNQLLLREAQGEKDKILKEAKQIADKMIADAKEKAQVEADKEIAKAKDAIQNEKKIALAEVKSQVAALSVSIAEKLLKKELQNKDSQTALVYDFLKDTKFN